MLEKYLIMAVAGIVAVLIDSFFVKLIYNGSIREFITTRKITYSEAISLTVLFTLLTGGF